MARPLRGFALVVAAACAALFLGLACPRGKLPAPTFQEGMHVLPALTLLRGQSLGRDLWTSASIGGRPVFLGYNEYTGSLETYPLLALFRAAGPGVERWRLFALAVALLAWLSFAWLAYEAFGARAALASWALLLTQPALLAAARTGLENEFSVLCLTAGVAAAAYFRWQNQGRFRWLALCAFALGVGCWEKILLLQLAAAGLAAHALFSPRRASLDALWFAALGLFPLLVANVLKPLWTLRFCAELLRHPLRGEGNAHFASNLLLRLAQSWEVWTPSGIGRGAWPSSVLLPAAALAPLLAALVPGARRRLTPRWSALAAALAGFLALGAINGTGLRAYHLQPAMPFVLVLAAQSLCALVPDDRALAGVLAVVVAGHAAVFHGVMARLERTGGTSAQSAALYDVLDYCRSRGAAELIAVRGAAGENLEAISSLELRPLDPARFGEDVWAAWLKDRRRLYLLPAADQFAPRPLDEGRDFEAFARARGFELRATRRFDNKEGTAIYTAAEAVPRRESALQASVPRAR